MKPNTDRLKEFNRRMSDLTHALIKQGSDGRYSLYVGLGGGITTWQSLHNTLDEACQAASDIGCGHARIVFHTVKEKAAN